MILILLYPHHVSGKLFNLTLQLPFSTELSLTADLAHYPRFRDFRIRIDTIDLASYIFF
jgi:hypothetical protein